MAAGRNYSLMVAVGVRKIDYGHEISIQERSAGEFSVSLKVYAMIDR